MAGLLAGSCGVLYDERISRAVDVWNALPFLSIAIPAEMTLGQGVGVVTALLAFAAWGNMVSEGREYLGAAWWIAFFPGLAIFLAVMPFNFLGGWMRDRPPPRLWQVQSTHSASSCRIGGRTMGIPAAHTHTPSGKKRARGRDQRRHLRHVLAR